MKYYNVGKYWTKRIEPHVHDPEVRKVLNEDFHKFTMGKWNKPYDTSKTPSHYESCDWQCDHRGKWPRYWKYVKHAACHWVVNFNLELAKRASPRREWRIVTSQKHSTVWDGKETLFDMNFLALGIDPDEAFKLANKRQLKPGKHRRVYFAEHCTARPTRLIS